MQAYNSSLRIIFFLRQTNKKSIIQSPDIKAMSQTLSKSESKLHRCVQRVLPLLLMAGADLHSAIPGPTNLDNCYSVQDMFLILEFNALLNYMA